MLKTLTCPKGQCTMCILHLSPTLPFYSADAQRALWLQEEKKHFFLLFMSAFLPPFFTRCLSIHEHIH